MLTAGRYLPDLTQKIINKCDEKGVVFVTEVIKEVKQTMIEEWTQYCSDPLNKGHLKDVRVFLFVCGYDSLKNPHLFYLDNMTTPSFKIQERLLFQDQNDFEFSAMTTNQNKDDSTTDATLMMKKYIINAPQMDYRKLFYKAFTSAKNELSKKNKSIGGITFMAEIDFFSGFRLITTI